MKNYAVMSNTALNEEKTWLFEHAQVESKKLKKCNDVDNLYNVIKYLTYLHGEVEKIEKEQNNRMMSRTSYLR